MPFKSLQQMRYMYKMHPDIATKWHDETKKAKKKFPTKKKRYAHGKSTSPELAKKRVKKKRKTKKK